KLAPETSAQPTNGSLRCRTAARHGHGHVYGHGRQKAHVTLEKSDVFRVGSGPHQTSEGGLRVFCPNCGTENEEAATTCKKCGFSLKGAAAPKFKGTMLMMNAPAGLRPGAAPGAPAPGAPAPAPMGAPPPG